MIAASETPGASSRRTGSRRSYRLREHRQFGPSNPPTRAEVERLLPARIEAPADRGTPMATNALLLSLLSGLVLVAIAVGALRLRRWRRFTATGRGPVSTDVAIARTLRSPTTWTVGFLVITLLATAGALAVVGALPLPEGAQPAVTTALLGISALVLGGFVFLGVYASVRNRGYGTAPAVGMASLVVGLVAIVVVVSQLFLA